MISKETIEQLAAEELADANTKHEPKFNSPHEAYAVIKEELEELEEDTRMCGLNLDKLWQCVRNDADEGASVYLKHMKVHAIHAVQEGIQVIAMCDKALKLYE